jgi:hypothetical protein
MRGSGEAERARFDAEMRPPKRGLTHCSSTVAHAGQPPSRPRPSGIQESLSSILGASIMPSQTKDPHRRLSAYHRLSITRRHACASRWICGVPTCHRLAIHRRLACHRNGTRWHGPRRHSTGRSSHIRHAVCRRLAWVGGRIRRILWVCRGRARVRTRAAHGTDQHGQQ